MGIRGVPHKPNPPTHRQPTKPVIKFAKSYALSKTTDPSFMNLAIANVNEMSSVVLYNAARIIALRQLESSSVKYGLFLLVRCVLLRRACTLRGA